MEREGSSGEASDVSEEWVLAEILGDHEGWEAEAEQAETQVRQVAREVGCGFFVFQNCPPTADGTPRVRIIAYARRLKDAFDARQRG